MGNYSVYLHIPFCLHRCGYCDFNTYAGLQALIPDYVTALCREIEYLVARAYTTLPVHTIFFGGGTPSLLSLDELKRIMHTIQNSFDLQHDLEATLEANPGALSLDYLVGLRQLAINRLSLGVQSANPDELRLLERQHDYDDVIQAVTWARQAGFDNLNLDLIFGLPYQSLSSWQRSLELALGLQPDHFSLYALTLEQGTPLAAWTARGLVDPPDPDLAADMYEWASERLAEAGYFQYEISNWARPAGKGILACRHNLQYWRNQPYLGFGAGAHGYAGNLRTSNVFSPAAYIQRLLTVSSMTNDHRPFPCTPATQAFQEVDRQAEIAEVMMMGLRLTQEGISDTAFHQHFGESLQDIFGSKIDRLVNLGLLEWGGTPKDSLRLTSKGRLLGNQVFVEFV